MSGATLNPAAEAVGLDLGVRTVSYTESDAILYALAVGARATQLDLVFERELRVLPTLAMPLGLWACDELGERGFFSSSNAVHGAQRLAVFKPLPRSAEIELRARVGAAWDKGSAAVFEIEVDCEFWRATYSLFAPGQGGWEGQRGPSARRDSEEAPAQRVRIETSPEQAALYRLTGDRHLIHIDPEAAHAIGQPRPIMHGLCTLGFAARELATASGRHPCDLTGLEARFSAAVLPGDTLELRAWEEQPDGWIPFSMANDEQPVLTGGMGRF